MPYQPGDLLLNKYRIEALLGRGAFAEVYRALDQQNGAPVAIKALVWKRSSAPANRAGFKEVHERFIQEAKLGMHPRLTHPHLVRVIEFSDQPNALLIVMELLPRGSLASRLHALRQGGEPFTIDRAVEIASQVAAGLAALHQSDIIHRDLHPGNILFAEDGSLKIADLGQAQVPLGVTDFITYSSGRGRAHHGHRDYRSPEQDQGTSRLTPAADIYSLGAVLFEMLTGRLYKNARPGTRPKSLRPDTPSWLDELVGRMLSKDSEDRPWDGQQALTALQAVQRQAEDRARQIIQYQKDFQAALKSENWSAAEAALTALVELGAEEAAQVAILRQELAKAQEVAQQRKQQQALQRAEKWRVIARRGLPLIGLTLSILIILIILWIVYPRDQTNPVIASIKTPTLTLENSPSTLPDTSTLVPPTNTYLVSTPGSEPTQTSETPSEEDPSEIPASLPDRSSPPVPKPLQPYGNYFCNSKTKDIPFSWEEVDDPSGIFYYILEISGLFTTGKNTNDRMVKKFSSIDNNKTISLACNGTSYNWRVYAVDRAGNYSAPSAWVPFTPKPGGGGAREPTITPTIYPAYVPTP